MDANTKAAASETLTARAKRLYLAIRRLERVGGDGDAALDGLRMVAGEIPSSDYDYIAYSDAAADGLIDYVDGRDVVTELGAEVLRVHHMMQAGAQAAADHRDHACESVTDTLA